MRAIKRILYFILVLSGMLGGLVILCAFRPDVTKAIAGFLYPETGKSMTAEINGKPKTEVSVGIREEGGLSFGEPGYAGPDGEGTGMYENPVMPDGKADYQGIGEEVSSDYLPPRQSEMAVPEKVSGRNGYRQVQGEQEQVDEEYAEQLRNRIDAGHTGDGLEFDAVYYPYYAMLDEKGKHVYRQIYANANEVYGVFAPVEEVTAGELKNAFSAVVNDHPELFWLETAYAGKHIDNGLCVEMDLKFNRTALDLEWAKAVFDENANQILEEARNLSGNYEKEKFVHDALIDRISYNLGAEMNQSAYSALVNGQTVCAGYARAFQYLLQQLGIPCYYCTGFAGESHAWNIVMLEDGYYNVDTTWDDTEGGTYDYFNKTDADYESNHIRQELSVYLPACNGQIYQGPGQEAAGGGLRSLEEAGFTEGQVITDMQGYYEDCYSHIVENGSGDYTFYNVIEGEGLLEQWRLNYQYEDYRQAYMESAVTAVGASSCEMYLEVEELQQCRYLISHKVSVR